MSCLTPPGGVWPADLLRLVEDIPHGVMMLSKTQQLLLLLPNLKLRATDEGRIEPCYGDETWEGSTVVKYFLYEVHVSRQFLLTTTLASGLYMCVARFLCRDYEACFALSHSIATDRTFTDEESQIFELLMLGDRSALAEPICRAY